MSDLPSQYAEEVETFKYILDLPDPRETMPRSSTTVLGSDDEKGQQELRPRGIWYKVGQPCFEDKLQGLNSDFAKICFFLSPLGLL